MYPVRWPRFISRRSLLARVASSIHLSWKPPGLRVGAAYDDHYRFPSRTIATGPDVFTFRSPSPRQLETIRALLSSRPRLLDSAWPARFANPEDGTWESFLAESGTRAFLVIHDDALVYEWYGEGHTRDRAVTSFSVAKSFVSALVGCALEDGVLDSVDDPLTHYLPELRREDPRFSEISIRNLLTMSSGLRYAERGRPWTDDAITYYAPDLRAAAYRAPIAGPAGEKWLYNNYNPILLGLALQQVTGMPTARYLEERLWTRLGMQAPASWSLDAHGLEKLESGINALPIDFAKFGRLFMRSGDWDGTQILPAAWVEQSTTPRLARSPSSFYGFFWWTSPDPDPSHYWGRGNFGQYVIVCPEQQTLVIRFGHSHGGINWADLALTIAQQLDAQARTPLHESGSPV